MHILIPIVVLFFIPDLAPSAMDHSIGSVAWESGNNDRALDEDRSLRAVILELEQETGFRVLYREALIAGKRVDFKIGPGWVVELPALLHRFDLEVSIDHKRKQVVIFKKNMESPGQQEPRMLRGFVIDAHTGERLPFSTIAWQTEDSGGSGTQADRQGSFRIQAESSGSLELRISHVGYQPGRITLSPENFRTIDELAVRLEPTPFEVAEIMIIATPVPGAADTVYRRMLEIGAFSPLGESSSVRRLQTLPSVGRGPTPNEGAFIRGSSSDALQVLLDGTVIYNQSHLFGLVDSFNGYAIRTSSFHYDVVPSRYQAPPGGTLNLITRAGSFHEFSGNLGISNSVVRSSLEGPLKHGRSSWFVSGRGSILDAVTWFNTGKLVAWGLDIDRKNSLGDGTHTLEDRLVTPGDHSVGFYDLHGKLVLQGENGNRWLLSAYSGYNNTLQNAERLVRGGENQPVRRLATNLFDTKNRWGNNAASLTYIRDLREGITAVARSGISYYHTGFLKEDFSYQRPRRQHHEQLLFIHEFENESELTHWHGAVDVDAGDSFDFGAALHSYRSAYLENSLNRGQFFQRTTPLLMEAYAETEQSAGRLLDVRAGGRLQYFSDGGHLRFSPRIRTTLFPGSRLSFGLGFSRNYQYLHRLSFYNLTTSEIWITATEQQKPSTADQLTGGVYVRPWPGSLLQAEGYMKWQTNLRFHEINIQGLQNPFEAGPWYFDNRGYSRGIELLFRQTLHRVRFTQTYTFGKTELKNPRLNSGRWYYADWDRRHQWNTLLSLTALSGLKWNFNWIYATGVPDRLELFESSGERLGSYSRLDMNLQFTRNLAGNKFTLQAGVYNLLNRNNPWYREWVQAIEERLRRNRFVPVQADIYDLGIQPSFSVSYHF